MNTIEILIKIIPMLIAILLGYILTVTHILKENMIGAFKKIIMYVTLPASIFSAFIKINFQINYLMIILSIFITCLIVFLISYLIAKIFSIKSRYFPFLLTGYETGMVGYALYISVFGINAAANLGIVDIGQAMFIFFIYIPKVIGLDNKEGGGLKNSLNNAFKTPPFWAIIIGFIFAVIGIEAYSDTMAFLAVDGVLQFLGAPTSLLICFVLGYGLQLSLKGIGFSALTAFIKVIISMAFAFVLNHLVFIPLAIGPQFTTALYVFFMLPCSFILPIFMQKPNGEEISYVSNTLAISSIFSVAGFVAIVILQL